MKTTYTSPVGSLVIEVTPLGAHNFHVRTICAGKSYNATMDIREYGELLRDMRGQRWSVTSE